GAVDGIRPRAARCRASEAAGRVGADQEPLQAPGNLRAERLDPPAVRSRRGRRRRWIRERPVGDGGVVDAHSDGDPGAERARRVNELRDGLALTRLLRRLYRGGRAVYGAHVAPHMYSGLV